MTDDRTVERVSLEGSVWQARVRYEHNLEDEDAIGELVDVSDVAQGAEARVRHDAGGDVVDVVTVPDSPFLDEDEVASIAQQAAEAIETQS